MDFLIFIRDDDFAFYLDDVRTVLFIVGSQICLISHLSFLQITLDKFIEQDQES